MQEQKILILTNLDCLQNTATFRVLNNIFKICTLFKNNCLFVNCFTTLLIVFHSYGDVAVLTGKGLKLRPMHTRR